MIFVKNMNIKNDYAELRSANGPDGKLLINREANVELTVSGDEIDFFINLYKNNEVEITGQEVLKLFGLKDENDSVEYKYNRSIDL